MASDREVVRLPGKLVGVGHAVECTVTAIKVTLRGTGVFEYTNPVVNGTPYDLPDGLYELTYGGKEAQRIRRRDGHFVAAIAG